MPHTCQQGLVVNMTHTHAGGRGELRYQYLLFIRTSRYVQAPYLNTDGAAFESFTTRQQ